MWPTAARTRSVARRASRAVAACAGPAAIVSAASAPARAAARQLPRDPTAPTLAKACEHLVSMVVRPPSRKGECMQELRVERDEATLVGSYSPAGSTAVVAVHGASEGTRSWYLYRHLHDVLPPAGIGVVTFDRRGDGGSTGEPSRGDFGTQADDVLAVADAAGAARVGLWGISQGGWVAPLAAARSDRVAFL